MIVTDVNGLNVFINPQWLDIQSIAYIIQDDNEDTEITYFTNRQAETFNLSAEGHDALCQLINEEYVRRQQINKQPQVQTETVALNERLIKIE